MAGERSTTEAEAPLDRGTIMALVAMALGVFVIANDFTALNVALPAIEHDFDVDVGSVQWVVNAYALVFGVAIVSGGRLADMFGRRRVFFIGAAFFGGFSALGALAPSLGFLIGARVGMGIGGALMWPAILGMTFAALPASRAGLAGGLILGVAGVGNAVGPLIGGVLTEALDWRWIFVLNVPVALIAVLVTRAKVHQKEELADEPIDYMGMATISTGLVLLLLALDQSVDWGWGDWRVISMLAVSALLLCSFAFVEHRAGERALIPSDVFSNARFRAACLVVLLMSAVFFSAVLYVPQFLEKILDYSAVEAGLGMLPMMACFALTSFVAGPLYDRIGMVLAVGIGTGLIAAGQVLLAILIGPGAGIGEAHPRPRPGRRRLRDVLSLGHHRRGDRCRRGASEPRRRHRLHVPDRRWRDRARPLNHDLHDVLEGKLGSEVSAETGVDLSAHAQAVLHGDLAGTDAAQAALLLLIRSAPSRVETIGPDLVLPTVSRRASG